MRFGSQAVSHGDATPIRSAHQLAPKFNSASPTAGLAACCPTRLAARWRIGSADASDYRTWGSVRAGVGFTTTGVSAAAIAQALSRSRCPRTNGSSRSLREREARAAQNRNEDEEAGSRGQGCMAVCSGARAGQDKVLQDGSADLSSGVREVEEEGDVELARDTKLPGTGMIRGCEAATRCRGNVVQKMLKFSI